MTRRYPEPRPRHRLLAAVTIVAAVLLPLAACGPDAGDVTTARDEPTANASTPPEVGDESASSPAPADATTTTAPATTTMPPTTTTTVAPLPPTTPAGPLAGLTVAVDPGHNGANYLHPVETARPVDAGGYPSESCNTTGTATADGYSESAFNWAVGTLLADELRARGATVVLTRASDDGWGPCIDQRGKVAHRGGAAALVSIHADGNDPSGFGFHVIRPGPVAGYTDGIVEPSRALAAAVADRMLAASFVPASYVRGAPVVERSDLATLNNARVPVVMVEAGNLRNPFEAQVLRTAEAQTRLAQAIADGLTDHLAPGTVTG